VRGYGTFNKLIFWLGSHRSAATVRITAEKQIKTSALYSFL